MLFKTLYFINIPDSFWKWIPDPGAIAGKGTIAKKMLIFSLVFLTRRNPQLRVGIFLGSINLKVLLDSEAQHREYI